MAQRSGPPAVRLRGRSRRWRRVVALALALGLASGCQFLVDGEVETVHCTAEGAVGPPDCPTDLACVKGVCAEAAAPPRGIGAACGEDADCDDGLFCLDPRDFGGDGGPACSTPCCSSSDCGEAGSGLVCWAPADGGGTFCRPAATVGRAVGGEGKAGEPCFVDDYCRSGLCKEGACADTCCTDTNCVAGDTRCRVLGDVVSPASSWTCGVPAEPAGGFGDPCVADADCGSGLCIEVGGLARCTIPCCDSALCGSAVLGGFKGVLACLEVEHGGALVRACSRWLPEAASRPVGAECSEDLECRSGQCIPAGAEGGKICSDVCCIDATCGDLVCRPHEASGKWALRCQVK